MPFAAQRWHAQVTCLLGVALSFSAWQAEAQITLDVASTKAALARLSASASTQDVTEWVLHSADHQGLPFVVIDKRDARVFVFSPGGRFLGASPALLGLAIGDEGVAGLGERPLAKSAQKSAPPLRVGISRPWIAICRVKPFCGSTIRSLFPCIQCAA
jgi:hypothetical protein